MDGNAPMMEAVFEELKKRYSVGWMDRERGCLCLSFVKGRAYRIIADDSYAGLEVKRRFFGWEYWQPVHYDDPDDKVEDILEAIEGLISSV